MAAPQRTEDSAVSGRRRRLQRTLAPGWCYSQGPDENTVLVRTRALSRPGAPGYGDRLLADGSTKPGSGSSRNLETTRVLLVRARTGDQRAVDKLVRRFLPEMLRWAHGRLPRQLRPVDTTEILVHDTILSALAHVDTFKYRWEGCFLAYLRRIFMNKLRDRCRGSQRHELPPFTMPGNGKALEPMEWDEFWVVYEKALETLPERMQQAVFLRLELDWQFAPIAECIGCPSANAARMYVTRGIRRLAREMHDAGY